MTPRPEQASLIPMDSAPVPMATGIALVVERLASNPQVDIDKLEKIIALQERILAHEARTAFNRAFAAMQADLPVIAERGKTDKARYATLEDIVEAVRPVLARYRFALSHRTEWLPDGKIRIVGTLAHEDGHEATSEFLASPDTSGSKNAIQAQGSALSYGRRYTTLDLLNIVSRYQDDDGTTAHAKPAAVPDEPAGFADWADNMTAVAEEGTKAMVACWNASPKAMQDYATKHRRALTQGWKTKAQDADKAVPRG